LNILFPFIKYGAKEEEQEIQSSLNRIASQ